MENNLNETQVQLKFVTKHQQYTLPKVPFSVPANIDVLSLNNFINNLLKENNADHFKPVDFDFLINKCLLRKPLNEYLRECDQSAEAIIEVEYSVRESVPQLVNILLRNDWISGVHVADEWILFGCYNNTINMCKINGSQELSLTDHTDVVKSICWIKEGDPSHGFVSVSFDLTGIVWQWQPGLLSPNAVGVLKGHKRGIETVGVSPDSSRIATGGWDTNLNIWSNENVAYKDNQNTEDEPPNKRIRKNKSVKTWNVLTPLHSLNGHRESISKLAWIDNDTICTASMDRTIKLWDARTCAVQRQIITEKANLGISWSPLNRTLLVSSADRHVRLHDPRSSRDSVCKMFTSHKSWVPCVSWAACNSYSFVSGGYDSNVKLWDVRSPDNPLYDLITHDGGVLCVDWMNPKYLVTGGKDNKVHVYRNSHVSS